ncbi:MAG TPA: hypothetical protein VHB50_20730 [Bryobacteraceae bacterium]|nr:hypothetical protein [Bryobacteraceae bacterium]
MRTKTAFFRGWIGLVACVAALGAPVVEIVPSAVPGVALSGPSAPDFASRLAGILPDEEVLNRLKPAAGNILILTNSTLRAIVFYTLRFEIEGQQPVKTVSADFDDPAIGGKTHSFKPESYRLVSIVRGLDPVSDGLATESRNPEVYRQFLADSARYSGARVRVSLDSVVFDDGQFSGPDRTGMFDRLRQQSAARHALLEEIRSLDASPDAALQSRLEGILANTSTDAAAMKQKALARSFDAVLRRRGHGAMKIMLENMVDYPAIRR